MTCGENNLILTISDLKSIWREDISSGEILSRFGEMNPSFESNENIKESIALMMRNIDKASEINTESKDDSMLLMIKSELEKKYSIRFKFVLTKLEDEFFSEVTLPMVQTILHLEQSQCFLSDLLRKKDRELQEYKLEKGEISREDLKTETFDSDVKNSLDENLMMNVFEKSFLPEGSHPNNYTLEESKMFVNDHLKKIRPLKRKIYSAKTSIKKPLL